MNRIVAVKKDYSNARKIFKRVRLILIIVFLALISFLQIFPFYIKIVQAVQPLDQNLIRDTVYFFPKSINLGNFLVAMQKSKMLLGYKNSLLIVSIHMLVSTVIVVLCGYVFAKKQFRGKNFVFLLFLSSMMVPGELNMITNFQIIANLGLTSTIVGCVLPGFVNVFGIFLVRQFMASIPDSTIEAARLDGANELNIIAKIIVPMSTTVISTFLILEFISSWNSYLWPLTILLDDEKFTVQLTLMMYRGGTASSQDTILEAGATLLATVPTVIVYFIFNRKFIDGMSISGLK